MADVQTLLQQAKCSFACLTERQKATVALELLNEILEATGGGGGGVVTQGTVPWVSSLTDGTDTLPIGPVTPKTDVISTAGDNTVLSVAPGTRVRLYHISFVPTVSAAADLDVVLKIGASLINGWRTNFKGGGFSRSPKSGQGWWEGGDGEDVIFNLSAAEPIRYNLEYEII